VIFSPIAASTRHKRQLSAIAPGLIAPALPLRADRVIE